MKSFNDEKRMLLYTYLLLIAMFGNLSLLQQPFDKKAVMLGIVMALLLGYAHFVIGRFFSDGDKYLLIFAFILSMIGIITMYRIDSNVAVKQLIWFTLGVIAYVLVVVVLPDLKSFAKYKYVYLAGVIVFMAMATLIGVEKFGSKNWVELGPISFQPSEVGKLFLVAYLASALKDYTGRVKSLIEPALVVMYSLGFMVVQKDLGSALIFFGVSVTMLYLSTNKLKYIITTFILAGAGAGISYKLFDHVRVRVAIWQDPWSDAYGNGLQIVQGLFAMASGGILGVGLGKGYPEFIPVNTSDFIFAVICEEMGLLIGFGIMILFFLMFYRSMRAAIYVEDKFSQMMAVGYAAMFATQVLVIIGGVMNAIPLTGVALPFVSYGGSSMLTSFFALGIIQKISEEG
ncbi:MAG: FtsW/RodA/SpoVE family cell cycle protein [Clostridium sp.]|uniref:FtsW/RodA/SpoVE family cell cycle protein n=1 Tax=Clostridium sp. TaxID=1506 RepID=UPI002A89AB56|nr:FtsW/RodA/SpoVE family cell cycle protein [Clostridium sp.]MDY5099138.1 FtsW/RodA/SpoVE family cell cycle protein [Clostridium sp.]